MSRPSEKALSIAEELLDYTHPGMGRAAAIEEIAGMLDDMNADLLEAVNALVIESQRSGPGQYAILLNRLREISASYNPTGKDAGQHELFVAETQTKTTATVIAGQMP